MGMRIYLAKTAHHQLIPNIYHKSEKGKPYKMDLPLLKNDIPNNLWTQKPVVLIAVHTNISPYQ